MSKPAHKKVIKQEEVHGYPLTLEIKSDGNVLTYIRHDGDKVTYIYSESKTKKGQELTLTKEQLYRLVDLQQVLQK